MKKSRRYTPRDDDIPRARKPVVQDDDWRSDIDALDEDFMDYLDSHPELDEDDDD